jgi:hypothetical protein
MSKVTPPVPSEKGKNKGVNLAHFFVLALAVFQGIVRNFLFFGSAEN